MDVSRSDIMVQQVFGKLLGHTLGQCRHEDTLFFLGTDNDFVHKVVYLIFRRTHLNLRIEQSRRTNELFDDNALRLS